MKAKRLEWLGAVIIFFIGIIHLYLFPEEYEQSRVIAALFLLNFCAAIIASVGIRRQATWGWVLGVAVALGSIYGYVLSRTVGMPGMPVEEWLYPVGVAALMLEAGFVIVAVIRKPWGSLTYANKVSLAVVYLAAVAVFGLFGYLGSASVVRSGQALLSQARLISDETLQQQYGVQVRLVGISMMGSIVDFRLYVTDAEKANKLLNDPAKLPMLVAEGSDTVLLAPMPHGHHHVAKTGSIFYLFFPNTANAVRLGTPVTVVFGNLRVKPVPAQ